MSRTGRYRRRKAAIHPASSRMRSYPASSQRVGFCFVVLPQINHAPWLCLPCCRLPRPASGRLRVCLLAWPLACAGAGSPSRVHCHTHTWPPLPSRSEHRDKSDKRGPVSCESVDQLLGKGYTPELSGRPILAVPGARARVASLLRLPWRVRAPAAVPAPPLH